MPLHTKKNHTWWTTFTKQFTWPHSVSTGMAGKDGKPDVAGYEASEWHYLDMGIYNVGGPNWTDGKNNLKLGCDTFGPGWCAYFTQYPHGIYGGDG